MDGRRRFDGIFAYLWRGCGENPHNAGLIAICANDEYLSYRCQGLLSEGNTFISLITAVDHYVKIDLKDMRLAPSVYSVKMRGAPWNAASFVRSWRFEGSNEEGDGKCLTVTQNPTN
jgi:hypothetical protein